VLGGDTKTTTPTNTASDVDFHKKLKAAIAEKNPSFNQFFKQCTNNGKSMSAANLTGGLQGLLKENFKTLGVTEGAILGLFKSVCGKEEIGQSDFTKLFAH